MTKIKSQHTRLLFTTLCYRKNILKYTIDEYRYYLCFCGRWIRIWQPFFSYTSRFGCAGSGNLCISIENWKEKWYIPYISLYLRCILMYFWKGNPKIIRMNLSCLFFDVSEDFIFEQNFLCSKEKLTKIINFWVKINDLSWFLALKHIRNYQRYDN